MPMSKQELADRIVDMRDRASRETRPQMHNWNELMQFLIEAFEVPAANIAQADARILAARQQRDRDFKAGRV